MYMYIIYYITSARRTTISVWKHTDEICQILVQNLQQLVQNLPMLWPQSKHKEKN